MRDVYSYSNSVVDLDNMDEYFNVDFDNFETVIQPTTENKKNFSLSDDYDDMRREFVVIEQDMNVSKSDVNWFLLIIMEGLLFIIEFVMSCMGAENEIAVGLIYSLCCICDDVKNFKFVKISVDKYNRICDNFIRLVKDNEKIKIKFNEFYQVFVSK